MLHTVDCALKGAIEPCGECIECLRELENTPIPYTLTDAAIEAFKREIDDGNRTDS